MANIQKNINDSLGTIEKIQKKKKKKRKEKSIRRLKNIDRNDP